MTMLSKVPADGSLIKTNDFIDIYSVSLKYLGAHLIIFKPRVVTIYQKGPPDVGV